MPALSSACAPPTPITPGSVQPGNGRKRSRAPVARTTGPPARRAAPSPRSATNAKSASVRTIAARRRRAAATDHRRHRCAAVARSTARTRRRCRRRAGAMPPDLTARRGPSSRSTTRRPAPPHDRRGGDARRPAADDGDVGPKVPLTLRPSRARRRRSATSMPSSTLTRHARRLRDAVDRRRDTRSRCPCRRAARAARPLTERRKAVTPSVEQRRRHGDARGHAALAIVHDDRDTRALHARAHATASRSRRRERARASARTAPHRSPARGRATRSASRRAGPERRGDAESFVAGGDPEPVRGLPRGRSAAACPASPDESRSRCGSTERSRERRHELHGAREHARRSARLIDASQPTSSRDEPISTCPVARGWTLNATDSFVITCALVR